MPGTRIAGLTVALALVLVACGGDGSEDGATTGAETGPTGATGGTAPTGATGATGATASAAGTPLVTGPLEAGTYTFDGFAEPLTFTVGDGWEALIESDEQNRTDLGILVALFNEAHPVANIAFVQATRVVDPAKDWDEEGNLVAVPDDLIAWFAEHPYHEAEAPFETTVGALPARAVDIFVARLPANGWPGCGGECVLWVPLSVDQEDGPIADDDSIFGGAFKEYDRQIVVEASGVQLLVDIGALKRNAFEKFLPVAEEVLATVRFG